MFYEAGPAVGIAKMGAYLAARVAAGRLVIPDCEVAAAQLMDSSHATLFKPLLFNAALAAFAGADRIRRRNCREGLHGGIRQRQVTARNGVATAISTGRRL
jgi:hypothetical protein